VVTAVPKPTPFIENAAVSAEAPPLQIRQLPAEQVWVLEEGGESIGRLVKTSGAFSLREEMEFRTDGERWIIRKRFWSLLLTPREILSGDRRVGSVRPYGARLGRVSSGNPEATAGRLQLADREYSCYRKGLRFEVEREGTRLFHIQIPWQDSANKEQVRYYLWPDAGFQACEYPQLAIMPLFWIGISPYDRDRMTQIP
jgi:hypothetical protein